MIVNRKPALKLKEREREREREKKEEFNSL
jgi:hypothetical protein